MKHYHKKQVIEPSKGKHVPEEAWEIFLEIANKLDDVANKFEPVPPVNDGATCNFLYALRKCMIAYLEKGLGVRLYLDYEKETTSPEFIREQYKLMAAYSERQLDLE